MFDLYSLLQEMIDYHDRCVVVILFLQIFFNIAVVPMTIHDIKCKTADSIWSMIFYCASFGFNLLLTLQIMCIANEEGINEVIRFISITISFAISMLMVWFIVVVDNKERRK